MKNETKHLRASSYSNQVEIGDGNTLLFSGSTLCMDLVPAEYAKLLTQGTDFSFLSPGEKKHLLKRGHLTDLTRGRELTEFRKTVGQVSEKIAKSNQKLAQANVSFILTYNCNLSCSYCYQNTLPRETRHHSMTGGLVDAFFSDCFPQLYPRPPKHCTFTLFGGEPLLPANREAITRILAHTRKFSSSRIDVTTNATTLPAMLDLIGPEKGKIQNVQVTLDGDRALHDETRIPISGSPTFKTMMGSIRQLLEVKAEVGIRVHLHPKRLESAERLVKYLQGEGLLGHPNVFVYFSPINTFTSEQLSPGDLEVFRRMFQDVAAKASRPPSNFLFMNKFLKMQGKKVLPIARFCGLGSERFFVIDPLQDIYQCYEEAGHRERRIGSFAGGKLRFFALKKKYAKRQLLSLPECLRCSMALFCGGGCPVLAKNAEGSIFKPYCHQNKEFIGQTLKAFFLGKAVETGEN
ncbi:MAG: SPASM domain-containing protein [Planctomycetota bacterium]